MQNIKDCAVRPTKKSIIRSFLSSNSKHLIITGSRKSGKTTLLKDIIKEFKAEGIITKAIPKDKVILCSSMDNEEIIIGRFNKDLPGTTNKMEADPVGFNSAVNKIDELVKSESEYIYIDEIGYLEKDNPDYLNKIDELLNAKKCLLVLRKENLEHLNRILNRNDVFTVDLDEPFKDVACVIMASGISQRFGDLKLLAEYKGKKLIEHILDKTEIFSKRVVVTRHQKIKDICEERKIDCILHDLPYKSDTIALGTKHFYDNSEAIIFIPSDQPELSIDTLLSFMISAKNNDSIIRLKYEDQISSPGLFPKKYYDELLNLPTDKGGNVLAKKYGSSYILTDDIKETIDTDTREELLKLEQM